MGDAVLCAALRREFWAPKMSITPSLSLLFKKFSHFSICTQHEKQSSRSSSCTLPPIQPLRRCCYVRKRVEKSIFHSCAKASELREWHRKKRNEMENLNVTTQKSSGGRGFMKFKIGFKWLSALPSINWINEIINNQNRFEKSSATEKTKNDKNANRVVSMTCQCYVNYVA